MAVIVLIIIFLILPVSSATNELFASGYLMSSSGVVVQQKGASGQDPFSTGACVYNDTLTYGVSVAGVDYFDPMDNATASHIAQAGIGGFYTTHGFVVKMAYMHFDALRVYYEQGARVSLGSIYVPFVKPSLEISGYRAGLYHAQNELGQSRVELGFSLCAPFPIASAYASCQHIVLKQAQVVGYVQPLSIQVGLCSVQNSLGSQGIALESAYQEAWRFRVAIGEEFWFAQHFAVSGAIVTNPVCIHFGAHYSIGSTAVFAAFVNHPVLGWSKGFGVSWARK